MKYSQIEAHFSPPCIAPGDLEAVVFEHFGLRGRFKPLSGERDQNFRLDSDCGKRVVVKVSGNAESFTSVEFQAAALDHLAAGAESIELPRNVVSKDGQAIVSHNFGDGHLRILRLVTFVPGTPLEVTDRGTSSVAQNLGSLQGVICRDLSNFFHPAARRQIPWDISNGLVFADELLGLLEPEVIKVVSPVLRQLEDETLHALAGLRSQVIHNDIHPGNVLVGLDGGFAGLIDFGDALFAPVIQELASSAAVLCEINPSDPLAAIAALEHGFHQTFPLLRDERELLIDAVTLRSLLSVQLGEYKLRKAPQSVEQQRVVLASTRGLLSILNARKTRRAGSVPPADEVAERRERVLSPTYKLFYKTPLHIVRGRGVFLYDSDGREYLDCYNNVPSVGHCHPHVVSALARQADTLNTHTRYLHDEVVRYAERLTATLPDALDTCIFVCSGTEANALAYQIARTVTGKTGAVVSTGAYHGNSLGIDDLSKLDAHLYPPHVASIPVPDTFRGAVPTGEHDAGRNFASLSSDTIKELAASSHGIAMLMIDPIFDNPGIFSTPSNYLATLFADVRKEGGMVVVDEVQSGLGRLGDNYWGFQDSDVVPDIVTMGKPIGNGHPLAAVVARRAIMDAFSEAKGYFNTFGGNPVSASVGNAVLDVVEGEGILVSVQRTGQFLVSGLLDLQPKHHAIGDVRGKGLFVGVDIVADRETKKPDSMTAHRIANGLKERDVLVSVSGLHDNVIKIRPPLVFKIQHAERLLSALTMELGSSF